MAHCITRDWPNQCNLIVPSPASSQTGYVSPLERTQIAKRQAGYDKQFMADGVDVRLDGSYHRLSGYSSPRV